MKFTLKDLETTLNYAGPLSMVLADMASKKPGFALCEEEDVRASVRDGVVRVISRHGFGKPKTTEFTCEEVLAECAKDSHFQ